MIKQLSEIRPLYFIRITNQTEIFSLTEIAKVSIAISTIAYLSFSLFDNKQYYENQIRKFMNIQHDRFTLHIAILYFVFFTKSLSEDAVMFRAKYIIFFVNYIFSCLPFLSML